MRKFLVGLLAVSTMGAFANTSANISTAKTSQNLIEKFQAAGGSVFFFQEYTLGKLTDPLSDKQLDGETYIEAFTEIGISKRLDDKHSVYFNPRFTLSLNPEQNSKMEEWVTGIRTNRYNDGKISYRDNMRLYLTFTNETSRDDGRTLAPFYSSTLNYTANAAINTGLEFYARNYFTSQAKRANGKDNYHFDTAIEPYFNYNMNDKIGLQLRGELRYTNTGADNSNIEKNYSNTKVGVNYNINQNWSVTTFAVINNDSNAMDADNMSLLVWLAGPVL